MEIVYDFKEYIKGIAIDAEDNIFVANYDNKTIDKVSLNNGKVSIIQSTNISSSFRPLGLTVNSKNEIYIGTFNGEIMKMTKEGIISSIAGDRKKGFADGIGKDARMGVVYGICFDENDIAYFCDYDYGNHSIRKLTTDGKVTTICGGKKSGNSDGKGEESNFNTPSGIVYNYSTKLFYITDFNNKSIRTMTIDGNVNTLCTYSKYLCAITIDGEGKLYVSTVKDNSREEGKLITVDSKGEIKQMNISVKSCWGMAFNSKGDLFFASDKKLCVIRNCIKYPHPILAPTTNVNTKEELEIQELRRQLASTQAQLTNNQVEKQKLTNDLKELETQYNSLKVKLQELEQKLEIKEQNKTTDLSNQLDQCHKKNMQYEEEIRLLKLENQKLNEIHSINTKRLNETIDMQNLSIQEMKQSFEKKEEEIQRIVEKSQWEKKNLDLSKKQLEDKVNAISQKEAEIIQLKQTLQKERNGIEQQKKNVHENSDQMNEKMKKKLQQRIAKLELKEKELNEKEQSLTREKKSIEDQKKNYEAKLAEFGKETKHLAGLIELNKELRTSLFNEKEAQKQITDEARKRAEQAELNYKEAERRYQEAEKRYQEAEEKWHETLKTLMSKKNGRDEELISKCKELIESLKHQSQAGLEIHEVPKRFLSENQTLIKFLSYNWFNFACRFPELSPVMADIETQMMLPSSKGVLVLQRLLETTVPIKLEFFICKLEETIESIEM